MLSIVILLVAQLCLILCDPIDCSPPGTSVHGILQGRILGVGCHSLYQGIFLTQVSNQGHLLHFRQILYHLSPREFILQIKKPRLCSISELP